MKIRIYYEDTDANNIAYHTAYLRFCERDRSDIFFKNGTTPMDNSESFFVVKNINADFIASVSLGDEIEVKTSLKTIKHTYAILAQEIFHNDKVIFKMDVNIVYLINGKISKIPQKSRDLLLSINK